MMKTMITEQITKSIETKQLILSNDHIIQTIEDVVKETVKVYQNSNKILLAGNGGSAADAQHIAAEFVSRFYFDRPGLPSMALTTDTSILTAVGNDYGFENIFARQLQANGKKGDLFIGISTSGNSPNIIKALAECKKNGIISVGLTGHTGGGMSDLCDYCIKVPSLETPRIQEVHILIGHIICALVEKILFG